MDTKRLLATCATAWLPWAAAHPHPRVDDHQHEHHVPLALTRAFEAAWKISVESVQAESLMLRAEAERDVAGSLLAGSPAVELDHREARPSGGGSARESEAALVLPLWMPGQKSARGAAADAEASFAEASLHAARLRVAGEVREAAWYLLATEAEEAAARSHLGALRELATDVDRRVVAGDLARSDAMAATGEMLAARAAQQEAASRVESARARWTLLTSLATIIDASEPERDPSGEHPARVQARGATERAQRQLDYVKASRREPPELSVRVRRETPEANLPPVNSIGVGIRIPFGGAVRNAPRDAEAVAALDNARAEERRAAARIESEQRAARQALETAKQRLEALQARAGLLRERASLIDRSFRAGETPLPELLRARDASAQSQSAASRQLAETGLARARLLQALGILP